MTVGTDGLRAELDGLLDDFKALALADVTIKAMTVKRFTESKRIVPSDAKAAIKRSVFTHAGNCMKSMSTGVTVSHRIPRSPEESRSVWYFVNTGQPCVNSNGESLIAEPGWDTFHDIAYKGMHGTHAQHVITRAGNWARKRWGWLALWPNRFTEPLSAFVWLDVIDAVAELAGDATLERAEWSIEVGPHAALWPVSMWKTRKDWVLGPEYSAEDEERIGDDPEVVMRLRDGVLKDSLRVIRWMLRMLDANEARKRETKQAGPNVKSEENYLNEDGRILRWDGQEFRLTRNMFSVVQVLFEAWEAGRPEVSLDTIKRRVDACGIDEGLAKVFQRRSNRKKFTDPVWDVIENIGTGVYKLKSKSPGKIPV